MYFKKLRKELSSDRVTSRFEFDKKSRDGDIVISICGNEASLGELCSLILRDKPTTVGMSVKLQDTKEGGPSRTFLGFPAREDVFLSPIMTLTKSNQRDFEKYMIRTIVRKSGASYGQSVIDGLYLTMKDSIIDEVRPEIEDLLIIDLELMDRSSWSISIILLCENSKQCQIYHSFSCASPKNSFDIVHSGWIGEECPYSLIPSDLISPYIPEVCDTEDGTSFDHRDVISEHLPSFEISDSEDSEYIDHPDLVFRMKQK